MAYRTYPFGFLGGNLTPSRFSNQGLTLTAQEGSTKFTKTCNATAGQSNIVVSNITNLTVGQYVTGVGIPAVNDKNQPVVITSISPSGNIITLNANVKSTISNLNVYFFNTQNSVEYILNTMAASGTEFLRSSFFWSDYEPDRNAVIDWTGSGEFSNIEEFLKLTSRSGIDTMVRWGRPPDWSIDNDYKVDKDKPFTFQNPANDQPLENVGVRVAANGTVGSNTVTVKDLKRAPLIVPNMVINSTGFQSNTKVTKIEKPNNANYYLIYLDKTLTQTILDTVNGQPNYNLTAGIKNFETYNVVNGVQKSIANGDVFKFDSFEDANIYIINLRRKGGSIPKDYKDFAKFFNKAVNRFGSNGSFWETLEDNNIFTATTASSNQNLTLHRQTITIDTNLSSYPDIKKMVVGMTIQSDAFGNVPATWQNGDAAYIPEDTKITAIKGNVITLSNPLNQNIVAGVPVKLTFPKVTNWQIWNEGDSRAYSGNNWSSSTNKGLKFQIGNNSQVYVVQDFVDKKDFKSYQPNLNRGANWPFHPKSILGYLSTGSGYKTINLVDETYGWAPTFVEFIKIIKEEGHATDPKCKIVSNALTQPKDSYPKMFDEPNGKYCYDIFGVNIYPPGYKDQQELVKQILDYRPTFEIYYGTGKLNYPTLPDLITSEYGWSTDRVGYTTSSVNGSTVSNAVTEQDLADYLDLLISGSSSKLNFEDLINVKNSAGNTVYWNIKSLMYFNWISEETGFLVSSGNGGSENVRGIYKWQHPNMKSGTVTGTNGSNQLVFSNPLPPDWSTGYKLYKKDESASKVLSGISNGSRSITAISSDRKTITLNGNLTSNVSATLSEGDSQINSGGKNEVFLYLQNKLKDKLKITSAVSCNETGGAGTGYVKYTTEYINNFISNQNSVIITGIKTTSNNEISGLNGIFTITRRPDGKNGKTFIVQNSTNTNIYSINYNDAYALANVQPKIPAKSIQDASLFVQGRV